MFANGARNKNSPLKGLAKIHHPPSPPWFHTNFNPPNFQDPTTASTEWLLR